MNAGRWIASICVGCSLAAAMLFLMRAIGQARKLPAVHLRTLPLAFRTLLPLAALIQPAVSALLPVKRRQAITARLESLGLSPSIAAERWESLRVLQAMLGLASGLILSRSPMLPLMLAAAGYLAGGLWLRREREAQTRRITRELPSWLDLMTVCVEAGATLTAGLRLIVEQAPDGPLRDYFEHVLREIRGGRPRSQAFSFVADIYAVESLSTLAGALAHAESSGMGLGQVLRTQAEQRTSERFARAEKLAMQAPVKMLGPLILCIFPCTFIVIGVPIAVRLKEAFGA